MDKDSELVEEKLFYNIAETAKIFGVSQKTIYVWLKRGWMKAIHIGTYHKITAEEVERFMTKGAILPNSEEKPDISEKAMNAVGETDAERKLIDAKIELIKLGNLIKKQVNLKQTLAENVFLVCFQCGYQWKGKEGRKPKTCPRCRSSQYDIPWAEIKKLKREKKIYGQRQ